MDTVSTERIDLDVRGRKEFTGPASVIMPEIFRTEGYVFFFYANENQEPMHVHVRRAGGSAKFWVEPVALDSSEGMKTKELSRAEDLILDHIDEIRRKWNVVFPA